MDRQRRAGRGKAVSDSPSGMALARTGGAGQDHRLGDAGKVSSLSSTAAAAAKDGTPGVTETGMPSSRNA